MSCGERLILWRNLHGSRAPRILYPACNRGWRGLSLPQNGGRGFRGFAKDFAHGYCRRGALQRRALWLLLSCSPNRAFILPSVPERVLAVPIQKKSRRPPIRLLRFQRPIRSRTLARLIWPPPSPQPKGPIWDRALDDPLSENLFLRA